MTKPDEARARWLHPDRLADALASLVVFLVALPLCIGIAVASGVPPERGLITGIVGGLVVGVITGSPLLVSGPAASLLVLVWALVERHGLEMLGPVVVLTGLLQVGAGVLGLGRWFRAVSPAVIQGMMAGIGALIVASQLHVMADAPPRSGFFANLRALPEVLGSALYEGRAALFVGVMTVAVIVAWRRRRPERLALVPPELVAVAVAIGACYLFELDVRFLEVSASLWAGLDVTVPAELRAAVATGLIADAAVFAFVASAATLLTATAVDQMQSRVQTDYDRELWAQGVGNLTTGMVGGLPMTGVIVRSSTNVQAGATSQLSTVLHGLWLLGFVVLAPQALALIPRASLGAILVVVGCKLAHPATFRRLLARGRCELAVALLTLAGIVGFDLFTGILMGMGASVLRLVLAFTRFEVRVEPADEEAAFDVTLSGFATFLVLPELAAALDRIPAGSTARVHVEELEYVDHAALETLEAADRRLQAGGGGLAVEWPALDARYKQGPSGRDPALVHRMVSLRRVIQATEELTRTPCGSDRPQLAIPASHVHLDLPGGELAETLQPILASLLSELGEAGARARRQLLESCEERILDLGHGVLLLHASSPDIGPPWLAVARLQNPIRVPSGEGDLLLVLLDDERSPEVHLATLGCLAVTCLAPQRLSELRAAEDAEALASILEAGTRESGELGCAVP